MKNAIIIAVLVLGAITCLCGAIVLHSFASLGLIVGFVSLTYAIDHTIKERP